MLEILLIGVQVYKTVSREVEEYGLGRTLLLCLQSLAHGYGNGMRRFGCGNDTLALGKHHTCREGLQLRYRLCFDKTILVQLAYDRAGAVITQSAGVYVGWLEVVPQRIHGHQRRHAGRVAIVVLELSARKFRTRCRLNSNDTRLFALAQIAAQEREAYAGEV